MFTFIEGGEAYFVKTDVANSESVQNCIKGVVERFGRIDKAFNNAGIGGFLQLKNSFLKVF
jgi:NAD(P)-dependent dehydrogenase (short-subunit alcohol dehydrogenase family)